MIPWPVIDWRKALRLFNTLPAAARAEWESLYRQREVIGRATRENVIAACLFYKQVDGLESWGQPTPAAIRSRMVRRGVSWAAAYLDPLLANLRRMPAAFPDCDCHLWLAADLAWLVDELTFPRVVIHLMEQSSIAAQPGMLWRLLAHDLPGVREVRQVDADDCWLRTAGSAWLYHWRDSGLAFFRAFNPSEWGEPGQEAWCCYLPVCGRAFAYRPAGDFRMAQALAAFAWLASAGKIARTIDVPGRGRLQWFGTRWPGYGVDEQFVAQVMLPAFVGGGVWSHVDRSNAPNILPADLAACRAANPAAVVTRAA